MQNNIESSWTVVSGKRKKTIAKSQPPPDPHPPDPHPPDPHSPNPHSLDPHPPDPQSSDPPVKVSPSPISETLGGPVTAFISDECNEKIPEPCWFYNNGGCRHKNGSEKTAEECKYLHTQSENVKRPPHLNTKKPCDKFNLEGDCNWHDNCKYSHRNLNSDEWSKFYPGIPYTLKTNVQKRLLIENKLQDLDGRMRVMEFKQEGISKDVQEIGKIVHELKRLLTNKQ